jgi:transcriptional regulator with XRE-family HTH domain
MHVKDPGALRQRRQELGLTQQELAALVGTTQQYISLLERGRDRDCSQRVLSSICRWLEVERDDYFEDRGADPPTGGTRTGPRRRPGGSPPAS